MFIAVSSGKFIIKKKIVATYIFQNFLLQKHYLRYKRNENKFCSSSNTKFFIENNLKLKLFNELFKIEFRFYSIWNFQLFYSISTKNKFHTFKYFYKYKTSFSLLNLSNMISSLLQSLELKNLISIEMKSMVVKDPADLYPITHKISHTFYIFLISDIEV